ncbi:MAG: IS3 family transposase [Anaerolineae bacterium]|nr:IS3 family transposase [Anaerolineae bacterium]
MSVFVICVQTIDFTYIDTHEGWLYLALVMDVFSRKIVGWSMDTHRETALVERALTMALVQRKPKGKELLHHSDRGGQYASAAYQALLQTQGITVSMSRTADPYDNALMESAIGTLKTECADRVFVSRAAARSAIFAYVEGWYNRKRLHSALGYLSPDQFEQRFFSDTISLYLMG